MPVFQIGLDDGRSLRIEADDQEAALAGVQHFQASEKPSGVGPAFAHGASGVPASIASGLNLAGVKTDTLDKIAEKLAPKDYKSAPIFDKDWGFHPGNIPQAVAEAAPGLATDMGAGWAASKVASPLGVRARALAGLTGFAGSAAARAFGPGSHENADARTGVPNSPVEGQDMLREGGKQALMAVPNALLGGRMVPGASKALAEGALEKLVKTAAVGGGTGAANDVVNQVGTTLGTKDGVKYEPTQTANAATTGAVLSAGMASPRAAAEGSGNLKYRKIEGDADTKSAATALANRVVEAADGKNLVNWHGSTKHAEEVKARVEADLHKELTAASNGEVDLSQGASNTLDRIKKGGTASPSELKALADEASPETVSLARQALLSSQTKAKGGISGLMEKSVKAVSNPLGAATVAGSSAIAGSTGVLGSVGLPVLGTIAGGYGLARAIDKMSGQRSPLKSLTDRYADPNEPVRAPTAPPPEVDPNYDPTTVRQQLNTNAKLEEGMAKIAGKLGKEKAKAMIAEAQPLLERLANPPQPEAPDINPTALAMVQKKMKAGLPPIEEPAAPEPKAPWAPNSVALKMTQARLKAGLPPIEEPAAPAPTPVVISPIARKMLQEKLKEGLPPEPTAQIAPTPAPVPEPSFNPNMLPRSITGPAKNIMAGLRNSGKIANTYDTSTRQAAGVDEARSLAAENPLINEMGGVAANSNPAFTKEGSQLLRAASVRKRLLAQPEETEASVAAEPATGPASEPIAVLMAKLSKKSGDETVTQTPHPEADQPYAPIPEADLYRKHMTDDAMVEHEFAKYEPAQRKMYGKKSVENREGNREDTLGAAADFAAEDRSAANALYHQLDHTKDPDVASKVIDHYTGLMSPQAAAAIKERYTPAKIAKRWKKSKKK